RVAVGRGPGDGLHADVAGGAGAVIDDHRLPEAFGEFLRNDARRDVGRPAGRKGNDHAERPRGPGLRERLRGTDRDEDGKEELGHGAQARSNRSFARLGTVNSGSPASRHEASARSMMSFDGSENGPGSALVVASTTILLPMALPPFSVRTEGSMCTLTNTSSIKTVSRAGL